jgi:hypothetical protein
MSLSQSPYGRKKALAATATVSLTALFAALSAPQAAHAQTFDAAADYSITNNPNGVWSAGFSSTLGGSLVLFNVNNGVTNGINAWNSTVVNAFGTPSYFKNLGASPANFLQPGQIALHPGPDNQNAPFAVLRFTAPTTAQYNVVAQFFVGDTGGSTGGDTDANILLNSNAAAPVFFAATTNTNPLFNQTVTLAAGNTLDFIVGSKGDFTFDTTPLNVRLTNVSTAAPEPSALALLAPILPIAGMVIRKRRRATA